MQNNFSFAWRCWKVVPDDVPPHEPWPDHNSLDQPSPPEKWRREDFAIPWRSWRSARRLSNQQVIARDAFSIAWCQRTQQYWVVPGDCTDRNELDYSDRCWVTLFCRHLQDCGKPGLWKLLDHAIARQHDSRCPQDFDQFLPKNFFMNVIPEEPCHFVGHLSLILGLLAMCPREVENIPRQIDEMFYHNNEPQFIPWSHSTDGPMDRFTHPGRAIVMQTGTIKNDASSREERLCAWEKGDLGPMVSSRNPTRADRQVWGIPPFGY